MRTHPATREHRKSVINPEGSGWSGKCGRPIRGRFTFRLAALLPATTFTIANLPSHANPAAYSSKSKRGECASMGCTNGRTDGSSRCGSCSVRHAKSVRV